MLEIVDFYRVLQVVPEAEPEVIQAAYRSLARKYHPDVAGGSEERMVAINRAWSVLGNVDMRAAYDRGRDALRSEPAPTPWSKPDSNPRQSSVGAPPGRPVGTILNFSRYEGWSLGQIARHDPDFLEWLARTPIGRPFRAEIETLLGAARKPARAPAATNRSGGFARR